ncbi:MAG: ATP-binding cassette domain-containing protein [Acidihalobacter sp.]
MSEAILQLETVESGYGEVQVLWGVSLAVQPNHLTTLVGANGAGKTTTLRAATGSIRPWKGRRSSPRTTRPAAGWCWCPKAGSCSPT